MAEADKRDDFSFTPKWESNFSAIPKRKKGRTKEGGRIK